MWANQLDTENRLSAFKFLKIEQQVKALAEEILQGVTPKIEAATAAWREKQLQPMVQDMLEEICEVANDSVRDFMVNLDNIRADLAQLAANPVLSQSGISPLERVVSGAGGLIIGGAGSAVEGLTMGYQGVIRGLMPQILIAVAGLMVLHLNPLTVVAAMLGMGLFRAFRQGDALTGRAKSEVGKNLADALTATIPEQANRIAESVHEQTEPMVQQIDAGLSSEIQSIRDQVEAVLATKQAGIEEVNRQLERLAVAEGQLQKIDAKVSDFILQLAHVRASEHDFGNRQRPVTRTGST
jgi:hypothetical protein